MKKTANKLTSFLSNQLKYMRLSKIIINSACYRSAH